MTELYLVRHGRTAWNADGCFQGHTDIPLSEPGRAQALALGRALRPVQFDRIVCSDLSRAFETAQAIAAGREVAIEKDARLREMAFGRWEGLTWAQILDAYPEMEHVHWTDPASYVPDGGEGFGAVVQRVGLTLQELRATQGERVLVVTHAGPIHAALFALFGANGPSKGVRLFEASLTTVSLSGGIPQLLRLNDVTHLAL